MTAAQRAVYLVDAELDAWRRDFAAGRRPARLPYGAEHLETLGFELDAVGTIELPWALRKPTRVAEHRLGFPIRRAARAWPKVGRADVVFAALEHEAVAPAWLRRHGLPGWRRTPLVALTCWLSEDASRADEQGRRRLKERFDGVDVFVVWSRNQHEILADLGIAAERRLSVPFGVDVDFYSQDPDEPPVTRDIPVLAVGQDMGRDYRLLFDAIEGTDVVVDLVCPLDYVPRPFPEANVRLRGRVDHPTYASLLRRAQTVVVPTLELAYPTGQSVALEASASGACVVATGTRALGEYFVDGQTALLVPPGDRDALAAALARTATDETLRSRLGHQGRAAVRERFSTAVMWREIVKGLTERGLITGGEA